MDLNKLRYFVAVAEAEHVTNAANRLHISQPALTRAVRGLEDELGVRLLAKEGRNVRLTAAGAHLLELAGPAIARLDDADDAMRRFSQKEAATVAVRIGGASGLVVDAIADYSSRHEAVAFSVSQGGDVRVADVEVVSLDSPKACRGQVFAERIGVAMPSEGAGKNGRKRAGQNAVALEELEDSVFICLAGSRDFRRRCDDLCAAQGFTPRIAFESDNPSVVRKMIAMGMGVGFWPERSWGAVDSDELAWLPVDAPGFERLIDVRLTPHGIEKTAAQSFHRHLVDQFRRVFEG